MYYAIMLTGWRASVYAALDFQEGATVDWDTERTVHVEEVR